MATVGEKLHSAREEQQLTVYHVAETTKIKTEHVRALEEGNYETFSASIFIRGSVRSYAMMLKLDVPALLAELDQELGQIEKFRKPLPLLNESRSPLDYLILKLSKVNWRVSLAVSAGVLLLGLVWLTYHLWQVHASQDPLANLGPGLYQPNNRTGGLYLSVPTHWSPPVHR